MAEKAKGGEVAVFTFHGVPDITHPWASISPDEFRAFLLYLKRNGYRVVALRDVSRFYDMNALPQDPMLKVRFGVKEFWATDAITPKARDLLPKAPK
jgi:hypothetical protein